MPIPFRRHLDPDLTLSSIARSEPRDPVSLSDLAEQARHIRGLVAHLETALDERARDVRIVAGEEIGAQRVLREAVPSIVPGFVPSFASSDFAPSLADVIDPTLAPDYVSAEDSALVGELVTLIEDKPAVFALRFLKLARFVKAMDQRVSGLAAREVV